MRYAYSSALFVQSVAQFHSFHKASGADWPAEIGVELLSTAWTLVNPSIKRSELIGTLKEGDFITQKSHFFVMRCVKPTILFLKKLRTIGLVLSV